MSSTFQSAAALHRVVRPAYLLTLILLQAALLVDVAPPVAAMLARDVHGIGASASSLVRAAGYALTLVGMAIVLAFPSLALARHAQRGGCRFRGLSRSCIGITLTGALIYAFAQTFSLVVRLAPTSVDVAMAFAVAPLATGGIAIMAAGALVAEIFRRSVAPVRMPIAPWHCRPVRIEVIEPPELATRGV